MQSLATVVCVLFIVYLFWTDLRRPHSRSMALWVPLAWMFLAGSRWVSSWLNLAPTLESANDGYCRGQSDRPRGLLRPHRGGNSDSAGRKIDWQRLVVNNKWIILYFLYCLASVAWTDELPLS